MDTSRSLATAVNKDGPFLLFYPRSLTTAVGQHMSFPPLQKALTPAADFSCFRLVGTVYDINVFFF